VFDIQVLESGRIAISGRLDAAAAPKADAELAQLTGTIVADLGKLEYISSAGIGVLVKAQVRLQAGGHMLRLANLQPRVRAIFHYAGLEKTFGLES
jgi:anti-anti-sigma factor